MERGSGSSRHRRIREKHEDSQGARPSPTGTSTDGSPPASSSKVRRPDSSIQGDYDEPNQGEYIELHGSAKKRMRSVKTDVPTTGAEPLTCSDSKAREDDGRGLTTPESSMIRKLRELEETMLDQYEKRNTQSFKRDPMALSAMYDKPQWYGQGSSKIGAGDRQLLLSSEDDEEDVPSLAVLALRRIQANYGSVGFVGDGIPDDFFFYMVKGAQPIDLIRIQKLNRKRERVLEAIWAGICVIEWRVGKLPPGQNSWLATYRSQLEDREGKMRLMTRRVAETRRKTDQETKTLQTTEQIFRDPEKRSGAGGRGGGSTLSTLDRLRMEARGSQDHKNRSSVRKNHGI